jgi:hypothetical protein
MMSWNFFLQEVVVSYFKMYPHTFSGGTEENREKSVMMTDFWAQIRTKGPADMNNNLTTQL